MSPIYIRPVREQAEHDRLIRFLQTRHQRTFEVEVNVGDEQAVPVKIGVRTFFPDLVLIDGKKLAGLIEIETGESTNNLEALAQWVHFGRSKVPFHLYVPVVMVDAARRFSESNQVAVTEIWTYRPLLDGFDLVRVFHNPSAVARSGRGPVAKLVSLPKPVEPPQPEPVVETPEPPPAVHTPAPARPAPAPKPAPVSTGANVAAPPEGREDRQASQRGEGVTTREGPEARGRQGGDACEGREGSTVCQDVQDDEGGQGKGQADEGQARGSQGGEAGETGEEGREKEVATAVYPLRPRQTRVRQHVCHARVPAGWRFGSDQGALPVPVALTRANREDAARSRGARSPRAHPPRSHLRLDRPAARTHADAAACLVPVAGTAGAWPARQACPGAGPIREIRGRQTAAPAGT